MFSINAIGDLEPCSMYVARPDEYIVMSLDEYIDDESCSLNVGINDQFSIDMVLTFDIDDSNSDYIQEGMYIIVDNIGKMRLEQPSIEINGCKKVYTVKALGSSCELENKSCTIEINMGTKTSQEYLVTYINGETETLVDPYTDIPFDWIMLHNTFPEQLRILKTMYNNNHFGSKTSGVTTITNSSLIKEIMDILTVMPRLKKKISKTVSSDGLDSYTSVDYVEITESSTAVTKVVLNSNFGTRIDELIPYYERYRDQLSLVSIIMNATGSPWTVENIPGNSLSDFELFNKKFQFSIDGNAYGFLINDFQNASKCVVLFNNFNRTIKIVPVEQYGEDTGIVASYESVLNTLNISNINDVIATRLYVTGGNNLGIEEVNFGCNYVDDLDYKMNAKVSLPDGSQRRLYVSDSLANKYSSYKSLKESNRAAYAQYFVKYKNAIKDIDEIKYKVPNDVLSTNWGSYSEEELQESLKVYKNLRAGLMTMYKDEVGPSGVGADGNPIEGVIKNTIYWYDYKAYTDAITQIECALSVYPNYNYQSKWSDVDIAKYKDAIRAWETEFTLFGTVELKAKIDAYDTGMRVLVDNKSVIVNSNGAPIPWNSLTASQRAEYGDVENNYYYDAYNTYYTNKQGAQEELSKLNTQLSRLESDANSYQNSIKDLNVRMSIESNFTKEEIDTINLLIRDADYSNENILTTKINTVEETVDLAMELYNDAVDRASVTSRPQLKFSANIDNILSIDSFREHGDKIDVGNWIYVQYADDIYVKLRIVGFEFNPRIPSSPTISIIFSDNISSRSGVTDFEFLIGNSVSSSRRSGGGSSGGGYGDGYGESNDIDVTISNTMLAKLLNSETFGTRVRDVILDTIDVGSLKAGMVTVEGLKRGTTIIDGGCIQTGAIKSDNYNGTDDNINNTSGSILRLNDGQFCLGGQNGIKFDGSSVTLGSNVDISWENIKGAPSEVNMSGYARVNILEDNNITTWSKDDGVTVTYDQSKDCYMISKNPSDSSNYGVWAVIEVDPNKTYTLSYTLRGGFCGYGFKALETNIAYKASDGYYTGTTGTVTNSHTVSTNSSQRYLVIYFYTNDSQNNGEQFGVKNVKLEVGNSATDYTPPTSNKYVTTITKDTIKTTTILCSQLEADGTIQGQSFVCGTNGETRLNQDGTFSLGGANGIVYTDGQIRLGSNVSASGDIISGGTISGSTISGGTIKGTNINIGNTGESFINSDGTFRLGGADGINYDASTNKITLGSNVTIDWSNVDGTEYVLTTGDLDRYVTDEELQDEISNQTGVVRENLLDPDLLNWTKNNTTYTTVEYVYVDDKESEDFREDYYEINHTDTGTYNRCVWYDLEVEPNSLYTLSMIVHGMANVNIIKSGSAIDAYSKATNNVLESDLTDGLYVVESETTSGQKYMRVIITSYGTNISRVSQVKLEKGKGATQYVEVKDVEKRRTTSISQYEISTSVINCSQLNGGEIKGQKFTSTTKVDEVDTHLTIEHGVYEDYGAPRKANQTPNAFGYYYERGGVSYWSIDNDINVLRGQSEDSSSYSVAIDGRGIKLLSWRNRSGLFVADTSDNVIRINAGLQKSSDVIRIDFSGDGTYTTGYPFIIKTNIDAVNQDLKIKTINGTPVSDFELKSDISTKLTPKTVSSFTASPGFSNAIGSVKVYEELGFAIVDIKISVAEAIGRGTPKQVLTIPSSVRPNSYRALTCVGYNTNPHRRLLINCYCNASGGVYVMIPKNTDGESNINGSDFELSQSYESMLSITGVYII